MPTDYEIKVAQQIAQYAEGYDHSVLPPIFHYWSHAHLRQKFIRTFGVETPAQFYGSQFARLFDKHPSPLLVSIGSGDGSNELLVAKDLIGRGFHTFKILGLDLIPNSVEQANRLSREADLSHLVESRIFDVNMDVWSEGNFHGVMAEHSLHHIQELEKTFEFIVNFMHDDGIFLTRDMIGRNGHMRWPETLRFVEAIWDKLPNKKRYNFQRKELHEKFVNIDCSLEGFEGIRAQDILPLLIKYFSFEVFLGVGGIIDIFVDRDYGANFNPDDPGDRLFIDTIEMFNNELLAAGVIKPTMMFARLVKHNPAIPTLSYRDITPERSVRNAI